MPERFVVVPVAEREPVAELPFVVGADAGTVSAWRASPPGFRLWMLEVDLPAGATLAWPESHGEQAVVVREGALRVDGRSAGEGHVVVLEADAAPSVEVEVPTRVLAMGNHDPAPPTDGPFGAPAGGGRTHVVGPGGVAGREGPPGKVTRYYATACCPTCRLLLAWSSRMDEHVAAVHSHTQDELIHLVRGSIQVGARWLHAGDTLAVPANTRYRFRTGPDGYGFLNYRPDATFYVPVEGTRGLEAGRGGDFAWCPDGIDYLSEEAWAEGPALRS